MFDVDGFVADCRTSLTESHPALAVKELLGRAVAEPDAVATGTAERARCRRVASQSPT